VPYLSASAVVIHYEEALYQVLPLPLELEFGMYPQSMPTEWTHVRTVRAWQSVRLDL